MPCVTPVVGYWLELLIVNCVYQEGSICRVTTTRTYALLPDYNHIMFNKTVLFNRHLNFNLSVPLHSPAYYFHFAFVGWVGHHLSNVIKRSSDPFPGENQNKKKHAKPCTHVKPYGALVAESRPRGPHEVGDVQRAQHRPERSPQDHAVAFEKRVDPVLNRENAVRTTVTDIFSVRFLINSYLK